MASRGSILLVPCLLLAACGARQPAGPPPGDPLAGVPARELYQRGLALEQAGDLTRAEQYLSASIRRGGSEERVLPALLRVCVATSRFRAAVAYAQPHLERHPGNWHLRLLLASILAGLGEGPAARRELELVLQAQPGHAGAHYLLAVVLRDTLNNLLAADQHFRRYLELEPQGVHAEEARGALLHTMEPTGPTPEPHVPRPDAGVGPQARRPDAAPTRAAPP